MSQTVKGTFMGIAVLCLSIVLVPSEAYKHVVFMHGILAGPEEFDEFHRLVQKYHPGTPVTQVSAFSFLSSLTTDMWTQVDKLSTTLKPIFTDPKSNGTILVCYSQGGLLCRGLLSVLPHNVETMVALSSPLAGQFGDTDYLRFFFPHYMKENVYKFFYSSFGQHYSVANYWFDPHEQSLYKKYSTYLAVLNNQSSSPDTHTEERRSNFMRLKNLVLVGGPDDGVITPWQSSQFGMYDETEAVLPMEEQEWFKTDAFGLKSLYERKAVHFHTIHDVEHIHWHTNITVFETCVKPWLT